MESVPRENVPREDVYPIVGIGASAGGLEAITELLRALPEEPGAGFVLVVHQDAVHKSLLPQILARVTDLNVQVAEDGDEVRINSLYIAPPHAEVLMSGGVLRVASPAEAPRLPIDVFLRSLAEDQGNRAIGVILSGAGSDGSLGCKAVKAEGGITFAQDSSAKFDAMPRAAVSIGSVDYVLPSADIGRELASIVRHAYVAGGVWAAQRFGRAEMEQIFEMLLSSRGVDFTHYKPATVERRIRRRMALHKVETLAEYLEILNRTPEEIGLLYSDILIRVTGFFRDPEVFEAMQRDLFPALLRQRDDEDVIRIWVPGCATGEEVYSLAMALLETDRLPNRRIQIFGTDISEEAVERARVGLYPENIVAEVSADRLRRFFNRVDTGYRVAKSVRDCCIFARQNLTRDPPFSRLDLVSCRNVMIYLGTVLQRRAMSIFHYALRPDGYLLLGTSETIGNFGELFKIVDRRHKIYQKRPAINRPEIEIAPLPPERPTAEKRRTGDDAVTPAGIFREGDRVLLGRYSPPGVLINDSLDIIQFRGRTSTFLEPAPGSASFNILKMAREGVLSDLRAAILAARKSDQPVRRSDIALKVDGGTITVALEVIPFIGPQKERYFLVLFEQLPESEKASRRGKESKETPTDGRRAARMKRELDATREYLQSIIEEQEASNEELRSANEEIQSSNEELQSTNEELETAKEELQSSNEELITLNEELEHRNTDLGVVNNDLVNLLGSVDIPIVMLDAALRIRRFNPGAQRTLNLIASDVGRSISDLNLTLKLDDLEEQLIAVVDNLEVRELEVQDRAGRWHLLRIRPYKTTENKIEGAVLVLVDIDHLRKT
jgi:two-component system CheB/CheR fusion protein